PFPREFSVVSVLRAPPGSRPFLLSLYDGDGILRLGLELGSDPQFLYRERRRRLFPQDEPVFRGVDLADGRWHRVSWSVSGGSVALSLDCRRRLTRPLPRGPAPLDSRGIVVVGTRLLDREVFQ
ncbi:PREDICTED: collagen alpha-2(XI) chain-like, partial [Lepidothrix coronata]|uniref:Collagen alpha-2(XI) chain-like n=1 Tax=Lepidothrix coronata TaxID=321398 RepID=A0A6J0J9S3_9PASS